MKKIVVLGGGTGGTIVSNMLRRMLSPEEWSITVIDRNDKHIYQPGLLFVPFGLAKPKRLVKSRKKYILPDIEFVIDEIERIDPEKREVKTRRAFFSYDFLVIATGAKIFPDKTEGLRDAWRKNAFTFYELEEAEALYQQIKYFRGGHLIMNIAELPFKCPFAPIEFVFLADWYFRKKGMRSKVEIELVTPIPQAFTKPRAAAVFSEIAEKKGVKITADYQLDRVDTKGKYIESVQGVRINYDLLVIVPPTLGDEVISNSQIDDGIGYIPTDHHTLKALKHERVYALGDATNLPTSKVCSVAHYEADVVCHNIIAEILGKRPEPLFDGHSTCFIVSTKGKSFLIDLNYQIEPLPGKYPLPKIGPFSLLKDTRLNWLGKIGFKWAYWNFLLSGRYLGISPALVMAGKEI